MTTLHKNTNATSSAFGWDFNPFVIKQTIFTQTDNRLIYILHI